MFQVCCEGTRSAQVLGLTNYSRWSDAGAVRACMAESQALAESLLPAAIASLQKFVHVGVTEQLEASIQSLAATLGMQLDGPAWEVCLCKGLCPHHSALRCILDGV